jgi:hypothetical protein
MLGAALSTVYRTGMGGVSNDLPGARPEGREEVDFGPLPGLLGHLLRRATGHVLGDFAEELGEEVSPAEFGLLTLVQANPGITQARLAAALQLDISTSAGAGAADGARPAGAARAGGPAAAGAALAPGGGAARCDGHEGWSGTRRGCGDA